MDAALAAREAEIVETFEALGDPFARYEYLIELGRELPALPDEYRTDTFRVRGCQAQVWLVPKLRDGRLVILGDSDALITRGLVALLIEVLSDLPPAVVADAELGFLKEIGLDEHLSATRRNGLAAMVTRLKAYAQTLA
jgi:cysteine desulfuration protein SufE